MQSTKRMLALVLGAALATMAFGAASASAATVIKDSSGNLCSEVKPSPKLGSNPFEMFTTSRNYESGGCSVHLVSVGGNVGPWGSVCKSEFDARIGPDGWGYLDNFKYTSCEGTPAETCAGDRIVAPVEYNPNGLFKYSNAQTDLNIILCAKQVGNTYWGFSSFDVQEIPGGQGWANQTPSPQGSYYYHTGVWVVNPGPGLQITH